jgi:ribosomal protein S18 acetylase RimI-like enzyme
MVEAHIHYRVVAADDAAGIFRVLAEVAPEIPLLIDTNERRDGVSRIIDQCVATGESWVVTDSGGVVVGFTLVEPDRMERFHRDNEALHLRYVGVSKACRRQGIFRTLTQKVMLRSVPLTATVKAANRSQMATLLARIGFQTRSTTVDEQQLVWMPA